LDLKNRNFNGLRVSEVVRVILPNFVTFKPAPRYGDFSTFQNGGRSPSWICYACSWTTQEERVMALIVLQNLVGIGGVRLKICEFQYCTSLA